MKIKYAIFDMDGLMIDSEILAQRAFYEYVGPQLGLKFADKELDGTIGRSTEGLKVYWKEHVMDKYGITEDWMVASKLSYEWQQVQMQKYGMQVKKGLIELADWFDSKGVSYAVATSSDRVKAEYKLGLAGIKDRFDKIITGDMVKKSKPDPEIFLAALDLLGGEDPKEAVVFEDSLNGVQAGITGGFNTIMVPDLVKPQGDYVKKCLAIVDSLDQAIDVLKPYVG